MDDIMYRQLAVNIFISLLSFFVAFYRLDVTPFSSPYKGNGIPYSLLMFAFFGAALLIIGKYRFMTDVRRYERDFRFTSVASSSFLGLGAAWCLKSYNSNRPLTIEPFIVVVALGFIVGLAVSAFSKKPSRL